MTANLSPRRFLSALFALAVVIAVAPLAHAQTATDLEALDHFKKGRTHYDLGRFEEAIVEFERAYELKQDGAFLFNIAQGYRQTGNAIKAVFFYKRYLAIFPNAPNRPNVEKQIADLEPLAAKQAADEKLKQEEERRKKEDEERRKAASVGQDSGGRTDVVAQGGGQDGGQIDARMGGPGGVAQAGLVGRTAPWRIALELGPAFLSLGDGPSVPTQASFNISAIRTLGKEKVAFDVGMNVTYTPVPYASSTNGLQSTAAMVGILGDARARIEVMPNLDVRVGAGIGALWLSGLLDGNPFTDGGLMASGPLPMLDFRFGVGVDFRLKNDVVLTATPLALAYSPPNSGLDASITSVMRFDILFGIGYAL